MKMWRTIVLLLVVAVVGACRSSEAGPASSAPARVIADSAGRAVALPARVERVLAAGIPAAILLYTLAPELMVGWPRALPEEAAPFLSSCAQDLPVTGNLTSRGGALNLEVALAAKPDLILDYGTLSDSYVSLAERVQGQTGIPYAVIDGRFDRIPEAYRLLGRMLKRERRAEALAEYAEGVLADMRAAAERAGDSGPRVYYARGRDGLRTGRSGALNAELIGFVGARNVAGEGEGLTNVSLEDVLRWDAEHIITIDPDLVRLIVAEPRWANLRAVREGKVHLAPTLPFGWTDRPPSVNRLIGVRWMLAALGLDSGQNLRTEARRFYRLFYRHELSEAQLTELLGPAS